jgi:hypothetical protein
MSQPTALTPEQIQAEKRPEHVEVNINGKIVCKRCFNVRPPKGWRMGCRRKMAVGWKVD